jgi:putative peptidoglycan lipid II flippase
MAAAKKIKDLICGVQGARAGTLVTVTLAALSKPVGYLRTLLLAWLFGASGSMDAFYVAMGILYLICQIVQSVAESALLPRLVKLDREGAASMMARVSRAAFWVSAALAALACLFPSSVVRVFARRLDAERLKTAAVMLVLLFPWAVACVFQTLLGVWNNYRGRYSLNMFFSVTGYALLIPAIWAASRFMGAYAVPAVYSAVLCLTTWVIWHMSGDFPLKKGSVPAGQIRGLWNDCLLCVGIVGAASLNQLVDRYFASGLAVGSITAIYYAGLIYTLPQGILAPAMMIYLNRASRAADNRVASLAQLEPVLCMSWLYIFPPAAFLVFYAVPTVRVFLGYGAFDANAVAMTAPCMSAAAWALPLMLWGQFLARYAQAVGRLKTILTVSCGALAANVALDWALAPFFGAPGLCAATGITLGFSALVYAHVLVPGMLSRVFRAVWRPCVIFAGCAAVLAHLCENPWLSVLAGAGASAVYYLAGEKLGFFNSVPTDWRPLSMLRLALSRFLQ